MQRLYFNLYPKCAAAQFMPQAIHERLRSIHATVKLQFIARALQALVILSTTGLYPCRSVLTRRISIL